MTTERSAYRHTIGIIALVGGLAGMLGLYLVPIPEGNREPLLLALGLVLGWGGTVIGYEFGSSPAGRKAADVGVRLAEEKAPPAPSGTVADPLHVAGTSGGSAPVETEESRP